MTEHYLFDWGDTLMVDIPNQTGPMCDWPVIEVVQGAKACLQRLSSQAQCHLATNAQESTEAQIRLALQRAGLSEYISRIFCRENLGMDKNNPDYYSKIVNKLGVSPSQVTMLGDSLERDVNQALKAGVQAILFNPKNAQIDSDVLAINDLGLLT